MDEHHNESTNPFAKAMIWGLWVAIFCVIFLMLYLDNRSEDSLVINGFNGSYSTTGTINDSPVYFLLDTGATHVVVSDELANTLSLENLGQTRMHTANGIAVGYRTELDQITFGPIKLKNIEAIVNPAMDGKEVLLGMSALRRVEFSQKGANLTITQIK
ncbi:retropepsin-like aspartic protease family protein [Sessilibacter corallicola]|uniref:retropepsin-like aspartic protease family protein n=1 Tax=Sessilibacter corallicola TaxID=2904075 RepID=UPI001E5461E2|nr:retropepsin-like aspartic protease [Sessilibacter corallicola]MCE2028712.1 retroviral-like aspartic protease family protein [Sessilibacter corallicola]